MPEKKLLSIIKSIIFALIFFALGRLMVVKLGNLGVVLTFVFVIAFYVIWWVRYQRGQRK
jgi:hypothetical protein